MALFSYKDQATATLVKIDGDSVGVSMNQLDADSQQRIHEAQKAKEQEIAKRKQLAEQAVAAQKAAVDLLRKNLPASLQAAYFWKSPLIGDVPDMPAEGVEVTGSGEDGKAGNKLSGKVPFAINPNKMGPNGPEMLYPIDLPGSKNIKIVIDPQAGATRYAGLVFRTPCEVEIRKDGIVLVSNPTLSITDESGKNWLARGVTIDQTQVSALFPAP